MNVSLNAYFCLLKLLIQFFLYRHNTVDQLKMTEELEADGYSEDLESGLEKVETNF